MITFFIYNTDGSVVDRNSFQNAWRGGAIRGIVSLDDADLYYLAIEIYEWDSGDEVSNGYLCVYENEELVEKTRLDEIPQGLTYDGENLWIINESGRILQLDSDREIVRAISPPRDGAAGIEYQDGNFYTVTYGDDRAYLTIISDGGNVSSEYIYPDSLRGLYTGISFINEQLWVAGNGTVAALNANRPPSAEISVSTQTPSVGEVVQFEADISDPDNNIANVEWQLTDTVTATGTSVEYTFEQEGEYNIVLTVVDAAGEEAEASITISVGSSSDSGDQNQISTTVPESESREPQTTETTSDGLGVLTTVSAVLLGLLRYVSSDKD